MKDAFNVILLILMFGAVYFSGYATGRNMAMTEIMDFVTKLQVERINGK